MLPLSSRARLDYRRVVATCSCISSMSDNVKLKVRGSEVGGSTRHLPVVPPGNRGSNPTGQGRVSFRRDALKPNPALFLAIYIAPP